MLAPHLSRRPLGREVSSAEGGAPDAAPSDAPADADAATLADVVASDGSDGGSRAEAYAREVVADAPIAYYRLEEPSGLVAKDERGAFDGVYTGSPVLGATGVAGSRAVTMPEGIVARVEIDAPALRFVNRQAFTIELWAKPGPNLGDYQWIASTEAGNPRKGWSIFSSPTAYVFYEVWDVVDGGSNIVRAIYPTRTKITSGRFYHIAFTYDGTTLVFYLDGAQERAQAEGGNVPNVNEVVLGCRGAATSCLSGWTLDEVAFYDKSLPAARIKAHYDAGK
ncbi:MAG: LamG domain-containing protein [Deltaproteobacteria bacterium]|nr:LamG domain-containing protein [Deltaproteobacteria bacterium]